MTWTNTTAGNITLTNHTTSCVICIKTKDHELWLDYSEWSDLKKAIANTDSLMNMDAKGKCPVDGREDRPIYIIHNNKRTLAVADGKGHAYKVYGEGYDVYSSKCLHENKYDPSEYEFERGLNGMDF